MARIGWDMLGMRGGSASARTCLPNRTASFHEHAKQTKRHVGRRTVPAIACLRDSRPMHYMAQRGATGGARLGNVAGMAQAATGDSNTKSLGGLSGL